MLQFPIPSPPLLVWYRSKGYTFVMAYMNDLLLLLSGLCISISIPGLIRSTNQYIFSALFSKIDVEQLTKEVSTMLSLEHTNVMSLRGVCVAVDSPLLIMPFMANGSVLEFVKHHKDSLLCISEESKVECITIIYCSVLYSGCDDSYVLKHFFTG